MRIAVAQINPTLGDFKSNKEKILRRVNEAVEKRCSLVVFPECALFGYHPFDLLERREVVAQQMRELADVQKRIPAGIAVVLGLITPNPDKKGRPYYNSATVLVKGKKPKLFHKTLLPTADVFDEARFIQQGDMRNNYFTWQGKRFFLTICEDIWAWPAKDGSASYSHNPLMDVKREKVDLVINLSASPWYLGKIKLRDEVTRQTAARFKCPLLYANLVGSQDEIIFDGRSFVIDPKGKKLLECLAFEEDLNVFDLETKEAWTPPPPKCDLTDELRRALVLGIRDFTDKTGIRKVHLGLSGGIDSAVVACLAADALGPQNVHLFGLPGPYNAPESLELAREMASRMNCRFDVMKIDSIYEAAKNEVETVLNVKEFSVVHENLQSRCRGLLMMAFANKENSLLLTTGNKSEYATGYATMYGDMCGGLAPIGDLTKKQVYELARLYNREHELIPDRIITRPPTAELAPNQKDSDSLPEYDELDASVVRIVEQAKPARSETDRWLVNRVFKTEFKRWQAAPILKASAHSFGRGRRYPVAHKARG